jgi:hypothetical protein
MELANLTSAERQQRMNIRNFLLVATEKELRVELQFALENRDTFKAACIQELAAEQGWKIS